MTNKKDDLYLQIEQKLRMCTELVQTEHDKRMDGKRKLNEIGDQQNIPDAKDIRTLLDQIKYRSSQATECDKFIDDH